MNKFLELIKENKLILKKNPKSLIGLSNLANLFFQSRQFEKSIFYLDEILKLNKTTKTAQSVYFNKGNIFIFLNKFDEAIECYDKSIELDAFDFQSYCNRGWALLILNKINDALYSLNTAIKINPNHADSYCNRGIAYSRLMKFEESLLDFDKAIQLNSNHVNSYFNLGSTYLLLKKFNESIICFEKAINIDSKHVESYCNRGLALNDLDKPEEAIKSFDKAINLNSNHVNSYCNRGRALLRLNKINDALYSLNTAIKINPNHADSYCNRGIAYSRLMKFEESLLDFDKCIEIKKNYANAYWNKSLIHLLRKNYEEGFSLYEWRWKTNNIDSPRKRNFSEPLWLGEFSLKNKTIFIHSEQGLGDTIQFSRYLELVKKSGAYIVFEYPKLLKNLLSSLSFVDEFVSSNEKFKKFDFHCPLMSLPLAFKTSINTIPNKIPYLSVDDERVNKWKKFIGSDGFKIAISWHSKGNFDSLEKSFSLNFFKKISNIPNIRLISLQKSFGTDQLKKLAKDFKVEILPEDFDNGENAFLDSAAILKNVNLLISCDTALGHLAGALGVNTWILLKHYPDWRWHLNCDKSPWYPNHKIFRQLFPGDWESVFKEVEISLKKIVENNK